MLFTISITACAQDFLKQKDSVIVDTAFDKIIPPPTGWVNDFEHLFTKEQIDTLASIIAEHEHATTNEISIVTIDNPHINEDNFERFVNYLHNKWGVGKKGKNNGVIICISPGIRKVRINNSDGITKMMTDKETKRIIDEIIIPEFKQGNFYEGTKKGLLAIIREIS
jgi:uncharacterized protein